MKIKGIYNQGQTIIDADVLENTPRGTSSGKAPLGQILRNFWLRMRTPFHTIRVTFGHYGVTFNNVTSGQKARLGRILRNFRLRMLTPKGIPMGSRDLRSLPVAMVPVLLYCILYYYYSKKKALEKAGMHRTYFRLPPQIWFCPSPYTTDISYNQWSQIGRCYAQIWYPKNYVIF